MNGLLNRVDTVETRIDTVSDRSDTVSSRFGDLSSHSDEFPHRMIAPLLRSAADKKKADAR